MDTERLIKILSIIADAIGHTFGRNCEVVVHDLRKLDHTIVRIINGHVTGRKVGGSLTDLGLKHLRSKKDQNPLVNYPSKTKNGKLLKSTTICFEDDEGNLVAALCINLDILSIMTYKDFIEEICKTSTPSPENYLETFEKDIMTTLREIVRKTIAKLEKDLVEMNKEMNKNDKMKIIESLDRQGVFLIKGAVNLVAKEMNVSKFTIYNYLEEIRSNQNNLFIKT